MAEPETWIDRRLVNALMPDARLAGGAGALIGIAGRAGLKAVEKTMGGLWVGGTAFLTANAVEFHANALNRMVHVGGSVAPVILPLADLTRVEDRAGIATRILDLETADTAISIRGYNMKRFATTIAEAARRAGGLSGAGTT